MHEFTTWEAARSGAGITVTVNPDSPAERRKLPVKKIVARHGSIVAIAGDGAQFRLTSDDPDTSAEVATIASELLGLGGDELDNIAHNDTGKRDELLAKIHKVAASALGQRRA